MLKSWSKIQKFCKKYCENDVKITSFIIEKISASLNNFDVIINVFLLRFCLFFFISWIFFRERFTLYLNRWFFIAFFIFLNLMIKFSVCRTSFRIQIKTIKSSMLFFAWAFSRLHWVASEVWSLRFVLRWFFIDGKSRMCVIFASLSFLLQFYYVFEFFYYFKNIWSFIDKWERNNAYKIYVSKWWINVFYSQSKIANRSCFRNLNYIIFFCFVINFDPIVQLFFQILIDRFFAKFMIINFYDQRTWMIKWSESFLSRKGVYGCCME